MCYFMRHKKLEYWSVLFSQPQVNLATRLILLNVNLYLGTCSLYTTHGVFKVAAGKSKWNLKKIMKSYVWFQDSSAQQAD